MKKHQRYDLLVINEFEKQVAAFTGAPFAVAVDCCTNALFLCLKYLKAGGEIVIPSWTYPSVPCCIRNAGAVERISSEIKKPTRSPFYKLGPYPIIDSALWFEKGMYIETMFMCLSFTGLGKDLPLSKGGMILTDNAHAAEWFLSARFCGGDWEGIKNKIPGFYCWMSPEIAAAGLRMLYKIENEL